MPAASGKISQNASESAYFIMMKVGRKVNILFLYFESDEMELQNVEGLIRKTRHKTGFILLL